MKTVSPTALPKLSQEQQCREKVMSYTIIIQIFLTASA